MTDHTTYINAAKTRQAVTLADGRTARLLYWPADHISYTRRRRSRGTKALVELRPGIYLSIPTSEVTIA